MKFIAEIVFIALLGTVACSQDSDDRATFVRIVNANSVPQQSDSIAHSSAFGIQRSFEKRPFQITNSEEKDVTNYTVKRPSLIYTPPNINSSASRQALPIPYSTSRSTSQKASSVNVSQNLSGSTFYNPQSNQLSYSDFLPLNCSELSPCLTLQSLLYSLTNPTLLRSAFRTGKPLFGSTGIQEFTMGETPATSAEMLINKDNKVKVEFKGSQLKNPRAVIRGQLSRSSIQSDLSGTSSKPSNRSLKSSRPLRSSGFSGSSRASEFLGPFETTRKAFSSFTTPSEINIGAISNIAVEKGTRAPETETNVSNTHTGVREQSDSNAYLSTFGTQQSLKKRRRFQVANAQQKNVMNYTIKRQSSIYNPLNINSSAAKQILSTQYSTPRSSSQQSSSVTQNFNGSTSYNPQSRQLSYSLSLPLNCSESSTCLSPQPLLFSLPNPRPLGHESGNKSSLETAEIDFNFEIIGDTLINPTFTITASDRISQLSSPSGFLRFSGSPGSSLLESSRPPVISGSSEPPKLSGFPRPLGPSESIGPLGTLGTSSEPLESSRPSGPSRPSGSLGPSESTGSLGTLGTPSEPLGPSRPSEPSRPSGFLGTPLGPSKSSGPTPTTERRPFYPFTPSEIGISSFPNIATMREGPGIIETGIGIDFGTTEVLEMTQTDDDLNHPPHIHNLDIECSKTMMTINIEFNRVFDGIIYSKGYYMNPECIYVNQNSGSTRYSFTVNLDSCGTQFINDFEGAGQAYLENIIVLQNEPDIQEVWDTVRRVRCLWEGNINKALTVNLSVDKLNQEIVAVSGDTATAKLDIQIGKGPFAPTADGFVKIGETMTLVVSMEGDPDFDLQVRNCLARDEFSTKIVHLTDERGCILKPKLFGAFQKTSDTGNTGASIIAYAYFQAFKFPDIMDLFIECNVELCKTNCEPCPEANQQIEPGRSRRSITHASSFNNSTNSILLSDPVRVGRRFKVIMLDDLSAASSQILYGGNDCRSDNKSEVCVSK